ncbi:MAG: hypothetical protein O2783_00580 [Chloroflexi bacterium]|nr:hypothetical protein [Chloroflexota bacterium]
MNFNSVRKGLFRFIAGFLSGLGLGIFGLSLVGLALYLRVIDEATWVQVLETLILLGLLLVTTHYARSAKLQAEASLQMAEAAKQQADASTKAVAEMQKQRQDAYLPVIDILEDELSSEQKIKIGLTLEQGNIPDELRCKLRNVGVGPALRLQYQINFVDEMTRTLTEANLSAGDQVEPQPLVISPPQSEDGPPYVQVSYRDVFGRKCTSTKPIHVDFKEKNYELGILQFEVEAVDYPGQAAPKRAKE